MIEEETVELPEGYELNLEEVESPLGPAESEGRSSSLTGLPIERPELSSASNGPASAGARSSRGRSRSRRGPDRDRSREAGASRSRNSGRSAEPSEPSDPSRLRSRSTRGRTESSGHPRTETTLSGDDYPDTAYGGVAYEPTGASGAGATALGTDDFWTWQSTSGTWTRHHARPRRELYAPDPVDGPPFPHQLKGRRFTELTLPGDGHMDIEDDWFHNGSPLIGGANQFWVGATTFWVRPGFGPTGYGSSDEDGDPDDPTDPSAGERGPGDGEESQRPGAEEEPTPEDSRKAGGQGGDAAAGGDRLAVDYIRVIDELRGNFPSQWILAADAGDALVKQAGSVEGAARALWEVREKKGMNNLAGVDDPVLDGVLHPDLLAYLRDVRQHGMAARYQGERSRKEARLHPGAKQNLGQVYKQIYKDLAKHRILVVSQQHPNLNHTVSSPFEAVSKMLPDRTLAPDMRVVHDQRHINEGTHKSLHPPAAQPTHDEVARRILWNRTRYPNVAVKIAKKDVAGAFRLLWVDPVDAEIFAGDIPWSPEHMGAEEVGTEQAGRPLTVIYLVSSFGFSGSPGEWTVWGRATELYHRHHSPALPRRDGGQRFDSRILVDDAVLVEAEIGLRPWVSAEVYEHGVRLMLGDKAVNAEKDLEEGQFADEQTIWGLNMNAATCRMSLPLARILKGAHLLKEDNFSYGMKTLTLKELQRFRGVATGWAVIIPNLKNELKAADRFLGGIDGGSKVSPSLSGKGDPEKEAEEAWEDLWALFEECRWLCAHPETWDTKFGGDLSELLRPLERLALPGALQEQAVFVTSDATLTVIGAVDWTNRLACREEVEELRPWVERALEKDSGGDADCPIHVGEMLSLVAFACQVGPSWTGRVVAYAGDNQVMVSWVTTRQSRTRAGRILVRVLNLVERRYRCRILGSWWRTFHKYDADLITRVDPDEIPEYMNRKGLTMVTVREAIHQALEDSERFGPCFLSWGDERDRCEMMKLRELRVARALGRPAPTNPTGMKVVEWTDRPQVVLDFARLSNPGGLRTLVACTLGPDARGGNVQRLCRFLEGQDFDVGIIEGPGEVHWDYLLEWAQQNGFHVAETEYLTTELNEVLARKRRASFLFRHEVGREQLDAALAKNVGGPTLGSVLKKAVTGMFMEYHRYEEGTNPGAGPGLPVVGGHVWMEDGGPRGNVYRLCGPGRWPLWDSKEKCMELDFVVDRKAPVGTVRYGPAKAGS